MSETITKKPATMIKDYFGTRQTEHIPEGVSPTRDFMTEIKALTDADKRYLAEGAAVELTRTTGTKHVVDYT